MYATLLDTFSPAFNYIYIYIVFVFSNVVKCVLILSSKVNCAFVLFSVGKVIWHVLASARFGPGSARMPAMRVCALLLPSALACSCLGTNRGVDEIVSADGLSVPIAEIVKLEVQAFDVAGSTLKTTGLILVAIPVAVASVVLLLFAFSG